MISTRLVIRGGRTDLMTSQWTPSPSIMRTVELTLPTLSKGLIPSALSSSTVVIDSDRYAGGGAIAIAHPSDLIAWRTTSLGRWTYVGTS